jgi:hypothetical protein
MFIEATYDVTHHRIWQSWIYFFVTAIWVNTTRLAIKNWQLLKQIRLAERERIKRVTFTVKPSSNGHAVYTITNLSARKDDQK